MALNPARHPIRRIPPRRLNGQDVVFVGASGGRVLQEVDACLRCLEQTVSIGVLQLFVDAQDGDCDAVLVQDDVHPAVSVVRHPVCH